jgi:hypothetical protein
VKGSQYEPWLIEAVSEVIESMCFMSAEPTIEIEKEPESHWISRRLVFRGPKQGSFGIRAPLSTARLLASNFLGVEGAELGEPQIGEIIGEISNMICGAFLGRVDSKNDFMLSTPCNDEGMLQVLPRSDRTHLAFALDEGILLAWLETEQAS